MHWSSFISVLALPGTLAFPWPGLSKRASVTDATLYAYGTNISGYPVLYDQSNGGLYIAGSNATIAGLQSVTWDIPLITAASTTGTTATMRNGTSAGGLYLNATSSSVTAVTIASDSTVGITVYGKQLVYYSESNIEAKFWVKQVEINGSSAYMLTWNPGNTLEADITPVNVKIDGPA